ncbi:MAG: hypothetical protein Q7J98_14200 [Kiritimatiellia bacterium]|nr:hypothetical protein [Kiritimatiellia bacterium]
MEQKQRNKIILILAVVLAPLLIYLVAVNITNIRENPSQPAASMPGAGIVSPVVQLPAQPAPVAPKILAEQKRIAALLPKSNPFNPVRSIISAPPPVTAAPAAPPPPAAPDAGIKLTAIFSRGSGRAAMINNRLCGEGDHIAGWTVIKVTARDVLLKNGAQQMLLKLR